MRVSTPSISKDAHPPTSSVPRTGETTFGDIAPYRGIGPAPSKHEYVLYNRIRHASQRQVIPCRR